LGALRATEKRQQEGVKVKSTREDVTPDSVNAHPAIGPANASNERGSSKGLPPFVIAVLVLLLTIAALCVTLEIFGLLVRLLVR
jgi:hypothetical protein